MTEDETIGWHHQLNRNEFEQAPGNGEGQGSLVCCSPWGRRVGYNLATEQQQMVKKHLKYSFFLKIVPGYVFHRAMAIALY